MKGNNLKNADAILTIVAAREGVALEEIKKDIQEAIDAAWATQAPEAKARQHLLFPAGKPTPEEFLSVITNKVGAS